MAGLPGPSPDASSPGLVRRYCARYSPEHRSAMLHKHALPQSVVRGLGETEAGLHDDRLPAQRGGGRLQCVRQWGWTGCPCQEQSPAILPDAGPGGASGRSPGRLDLLPEVERLVHVQLALARQRRQHVLVQPDELRRRAPAHTPRPAQPPTAADRGPPPGQAANTPRSRASQRSILNSKSQGTAVLQPPQGQRSSCITEQALPSGLRGCG